MRKIVFATWLCAGLSAFGEDVAALEGRLHDSILEKVNAVNPVDPATGERKYISFGFISDIHKCKRVSGDDAASNPDKTYWYGSAGCLTEAEQSIRLLGAVATDAGLDAVINGGDLSTAPISNNKGLTEEEYTNEIWNVKAMFDRHLPASVPLFTVDGNHERSYSLNGAFMNMSDATWAYVLTNFNTSAAAAATRGVTVTYHRDLARAKLGDNVWGRYAGNTFHLDFRRLYATRGYNVRICCLNAYDSAVGSDYPCRVYDAAQFYDSDGTPLYGEMTPANTVMGLVAHGSEEKPTGKSEMVRYAAGDLQNGFMNGYSNAKSKVGPWNLAQRGKGFFGLVSAHFHFTNSKNIVNTMDSQVNPDNDVYASAISVASAYAVNYPAKPSQHELGTESAYHFSIFVVDTDANLLREVRVGGWTTNPTTHESPVVQPHQTNIRTHLDAPVPILPTAETSIQEAIDAAAPTHGTVTLGEGLFEIHSQLMVTGGVTLVGQGYKKTILKYVGSKNTAASRVATVRDGSVISKVAITGASVIAQNGAGAVSISDGTVSCCCVTNNTNTQGTGGGITANGSGHVRIERTIVANNVAATVFDGMGGGIGIRGDNGLRVEIDSCQVYGNRSGGSEYRHGAGIGISGRNSVTTVIRNTTITNNAATGTATLGGGLYIAQRDTALIDCTIFGNTAETTGEYFGDVNMAFPSFAIESAVAAKSSGNAFSGAAVPLPPVFGTVMLVPSVRSVAISGVIRSLGTDATACDVYLSLDGGAAKKIFTGATATFDYDVSGLDAETTYSYALSVSNNATATKGVTKTGAFTTRKPTDPALLADYTAYRKDSGAPQSIMLSYYDGPDTRGFAWQTAASVTSGKVWLRKGDYATADDIVGKPNTSEILATPVEHTAKNCTTYRAHTGTLSAGLWSYCLGSGDRTTCGQFTVSDGAVAFTAVNVNDVQTKDSAKLFRWGNTIDAVCRALPAGFDFVLSGGDFIDGVSDVGADNYVQWGVVADTARSKFGDTPWIMACGNHEDEQFDRQGDTLFRDLVGEHHVFVPAADAKNQKHCGGHAFRQDGACIVSLPFYDNASPVEANVVAWLCEELNKAADANWRIVILHAGPYTVGENSAGEAFIKQLTPIFAQGKVDLVLQAHDHTYSKTLPYRWTGAGYTKDASDPAVVNLAPTTTNVQEFAGVPFYLDPKGTFYVSAGCAGHRFGEAHDWEKNGVWSYTKRTYKTVTDTVKVKSNYAEVGADGAKDVGMPMFAVLKVNGRFLTYDWYVAETDGTATLFDTLRICKTGSASDKPPQEQEDDDADRNDDLSHYKWAVIGDSLSDPTLSNKDEGPLKYYHYLQQTSGIRVVYTNGVGSTGYKAGADKNKCFYQRLEANPIPSDTDVVTIFGSVNDGGSADTEEHAGSPTDALPEKDTLAAYINKTLDLVHEQAPNAKIILSGGLFFENAHPDRHIRVNETLRKIAAVRGVAFYDWLTENPDDPLDFHQIVVNKSEDGCFGSRYTYDWATRGRIGESFGHPNALYNEIWLAPHFEEILTAALKPTLDGVTAVPAETNAMISGTVATLGVGATACDVYLAIGKDGEKLGAATKIATGLGQADSFLYVISNLTAGTAYGYELSVSNNAAFVTGTSVDGAFTTKRIAVAVDGLGAFAKKVTFTVDYDGAASLGGMPVPVRIAADKPVGFRYSDCETDGGDIRFVDADGKAIPFEIDTWNPQGESLIWVKAPTITKGAVFTMYYSGTPSTANESTATWADYTGVWHLNDLGADTTEHSQGRYPNSTATPNIDGHLSPKSFADETGLFGKAFRTNDSTGWNVGNFKEGGVWVSDSGANSPLDAGGVFTISGWFKHNDWGYNYDYIFSRRLNADNSGTPNGSFAVQLARNGNDNIVQARGASSARTRNETPAASLKGVWTYLTFVYNGTSCSIYENGALNSSGTIAVASDNDEPLVFGNNINIASGETGSNAWNGWIDEVRYVNGVAKSAEWIAAEYAAMASDTFVTASEVADVGSETPPSDPSGDDDPDPGVPADAILPSGGDDAATIQSAIDAAVLTKGIVTLGNGLFEVKTQLMVTGGVTVVGQGWTNTVVKYTGAANTANSRVATVNGGSTLSRLALTGATVGQNQYCAGGVSISDGTISWCCITNNSNRNSTGGGIGIWGVGTVKIDHTIVANNSAATGFEGAGGGIGMRPGGAGLSVEIDSCLVCNNTVGAAGKTSCGGGIGILYKKVADGASDLSKVDVVIRNTTIANNQVAGTGKGGGLYATQSKVILQNCILADNTVASDGDPNVAFISDDVQTAVAGRTSNCLFGNGTTAVGTGSVGVEGAVGFVDGTTGDFHLLASSPAVKMGTPDAGVEKDLDGHDFANPPSVGCYELPGAEPQPPTPPEPPTPPAPRPSGFSREVTFTVEYESGESLGGLPVLVKLSADSPKGFTYDDCAEDGSDIRFVDADGEAIPFEIDTWDPSGESLIWVKPPSLAKGTTFTMRYRGNPDEASDPTAVWTDYTGVWHFGALGADTTAHSQGLYPNSTSAENIDAHLSPKSIAGEEGRFGKSFRPNDAPNRASGNFNEGGAWVVDTGDNSPLDVGDIFTISGWIKHQNWNYNYDKIVYKRSGSDNSKSDPDGAFVVEIQSSTSDNRLAGKGSGDNRVRIDSADDARNPPNPKNGWIYFTFVFNGQKHSLYVNGGEFAKTANYLSRVVDNNAPLVFGNTVTIANGETGANAWNGWIDEIRLAKGAKSAEWIAAEYAAMTSDAFLSAGEVKNVGMGLLIILR